MRWLRRILRGGPPRAALTGDLARRIRDSFEEAAADEEHFPSTIDPRIYHVRLIAGYFQSLTAPRLLDVGSGKGRFGRALRQERPEVRICASDLSHAMLKHAGAELMPCVSTMTALPFADASFDGAYATESLEHAVDIERAVAEICRVVRPGGRIVVIDKNAEHWGRLKTPEWECWFGREELERLLARHCRTVSSQLISYWEDVEPDGLFAAWLAEK